MGHSKGPWIIHTPKRSENYPLVQTQGTQDEYINICEVWENVDANAALIAAAPDMLEALEETLSCIDQHTDDEVIGPIIEEAKRAINKAKGVK